MDLTSGARVKSLCVAGGIAGAVPFILSVSSSVSVNGNVVHYRDNVAIACGAIALVIGVIALVIAIRGKAGGAALGMAAGVLALGGYQLAKGFGAFLPDVPGASDIRVSHHELPDLPAPPPKPVGPTDCPDAPSCFHIARSLEKSDPKASVVADQRACEFKDGAGCYNTGIGWQEGTAGGKDLAKALQFFVKACELDDAAGCANAGASYIKGDGTEKDVAKGFDLEKKACDLKGANGCKNLGAMYRDGVGVKKDAAQSFAHYSEACEIGGSESAAAGCNMAGVALVEGKTKISKADGEKAHALFARGCELKDSYCYNLGISFEQGIGTKKDPAKARAAYEKACGDDSADACNNFGSMLNEGQGGPKDKAKAKELFDRACKAGIELGCKNLKTAK